MDADAISILAWNIRQGGGRRTEQILDGILRLSPTAVVLSEFRNNTSGSIIRERLASHGYHHQVAPDTPANVNTVLVASLVEGKPITFPDSDEEFAHSIARLDLPAFRLYGLYMPHKKKHNQFEFLVNEELDDEIPSMIAGDWNTGKNGIDQVGNSFWYSEYLTEIESRGYFDAFRAAKGDVKEYSWFSHQGNGFRYDHIYMHAALRTVLSDCYYVHELRNAGLSDHSAMIAELKP